MLAIRMQRTGRKGHAMFRMVVQEARLTPTSGKIVAQLGSYDPHTKGVVLDKALAETFLKNGAQPSDRIIGLLQKEGVTLPKWVKTATTKSGKLRNPEKLRKNRPAEPVAEEAAAEPETVDAAAEPEAPAEAPAAAKAAEPETDAAEKPEA